MDALTELAQAAKRNDNQQPAAKSHTLNYQVTHTQERLPKLELMRCGFFFGIGFLAATLATAIAMHLIGGMIIAATLSRLVR